MEETEKGEVVDGGWTLQDSQRIKRKKVVFQKKPNKASNMEINRSEQDEHNNNNNDNGDEEMIGDIPGLQEHKTGILKTGTNQAQQQQQGGFDYQDVAGSGQGGHG